MVDETPPPEYSQEEVEKAIAEFVAEEQARDIKTELSFAEFKKLMNSALENELITEDVKEIKDDLRHQLHAALDSQFPKFTADEKFFPARKGQAGTNASKMPNLLTEICDATEIDLADEARKKIAKCIVDTVNWELRNGSAKHGWMDFVKNLKKTQPSAVNNFEGIKTFQMGKKIRNTFLCSQLPVELHESFYKSSNTNNSKRERKGYHGIKGANDFGIRASNGCAKGHRL